MAELSFDYIFGRRAVFEALESDIHVSKVWTSDVSDISSKVNRNVEVVNAGNAELDRLVGGAKHQGVVAKVKPYEYVDLVEIIENARSEFEASGASLIVICDHITDVHNLGAIIRSAESVGASGVVIEKARSASVTPTVYKTSAGAVSHMKIAQVANVSRSVEELQGSGFWVIGATEHADERLFDASLKGNIALVLGNEQKGISAGVMKKCDELCALPQRGAVSSLNVSAASTVFMYEWARQNGL